MARRYTRLEKQVPAIGAGATVEVTLPAGASGVLIAIQNSTYAWDYGQESGDIVATDHLPLNGGGVVQIAGPLVSEHTFEAKNNGGAASKLVVFYERPTA